MSTEHVKALDRQRDANIRRAKQTSQLRAGWVLESEMTAAQHLQLQRRLKHECLARLARVSS